MKRRSKLKKAAAFTAAAVPVSMGALFLSAEAASASTTGSSYVVQPGDTLSAIAARHGTTWPALAGANHLANPNLIFPGQVIVLGSSTSASSSYHAVSTSSVSDPDHDGDNDGAESAAAPVHTYTAPTHTSYSTPVRAVSRSVSRVSPSSSFQACVIQKESSGNSQVMNSSGHYGLYQFDLSTWESGGGSASSFGHASVAQQNAVFNSVYAARGTSPWAPYDGC